MKSKKMSKKSSKGKGKGSGKSGGKMDKSNKHETKGKGKGNGDYYYKGKGKGNVGMASPTMPPANATDFPTMSPNTQSTYISVCYRQTFTKIFCSFSRNTYCLQVPLLRQRLRESRWF